MLRKLLPALLALFGLAAGAGAGMYLRPSSLDAAATAVKDAHGKEPASAEVAAPGKGGHVEESGASHGDAADDGHVPPGKEGDKPAHDYVKLNNQFVVPVVNNGRVGALVILSLSLEVTTGSTEMVYKVEPKLRDGFLQVMFDHANAGGFKGTFTDGSNMILLREALLEVAQSTLGADVTDVLIVDIVRQDN